MLFISVGAPYVEALRNNRALNAVLPAIMAAVVGAIPDQCGVRFGRGAAMPRLDFKLGMTTTRAGCGIAGLSFTQRQRGNSIDQLFRTWLTASLRHRRLRRAQHCIMLVI